MLRTKTKDCVMNKYIYIILLFFLAACEKEDILGYQLTEDCIQFNFDAAEMSTEYNFAEQTYVVQDGYYTQTKYYGDSLLCDTIELPLSIIGWERDYVREFKLRLTPVVDGVDTLPMATVLIDSSYVFQAEQLLDTIRLVFFRPEAGERLGAGITFDLAGEDAAFDMGAAEQSVYDLIVENVYEKSSNWDESYLGEFSQDKAAFIVTYYQNALNYISSWADCNIQLREALERYNAEHPDAPLDFEFPAYSQPAWWAANEEWLGEYSEAKRAFIIWRLGDYNWSEWTNWELKSLELGYYYDIYFEENPDAESFDFSFRTVVQPDWWAANEQYLGRFSVEKAIFMEDYYYGSIIWTDGGNRDWATEVGYLVSNLAYYVTRQPAPPYFEDDFYRPAQPAWWDKASGYLGKYSDAKKVFLQNFFKDEKGEWWDKEAANVKWEDYVDDLIEAYKALDKPEFECDFDPTGQWKEESKDDGKK